MPGTKIRAGVRHLRSPDNKLLSENIAATDNLGDIWARLGGEVEHLGLGRSGGARLYYCAQDIADDDVFGFIGLRESDCDGTVGGVGIQIYEAF